MADGLRNCGVPLGGIGAGSVELRADGYLRDWQIMNNRPWGAGPAFAPPPGGAHHDAHAGPRCDASYFGLLVRGAGHDRCAMLGLAPEYAVHLNDPYHLPWLERPRAIAAEASFPFMELRYEFARFPLDVRLEAFSPFIPLDAKNSALPLAYFTFTLRNRTRRPLRVSLFNATRNLVGYDRAEQASTIDFARRGRRSLPRARGFREGRRDDSCHIDGAVFQG